MKLEFSSIAGVISAGIFFASNCSAASVYMFSGTVTDLYLGTSMTAASSELQSHYAARGADVGSAVQLQVLVDFSRQGQMTNESGTKTIFADVPIRPNCDTCYGSSGKFYDYASLISSSIDISGSFYYPGQTSYDLATSNYSTGMASEYHSGDLTLGNYLQINSLGYGSESDLVYRWAASPYSDFGFSIYLNDGAGLVNSHGRLKLLSVTAAPTEVPIPASAWLFGSALVCLTRFRKKQ